MSTSHLPAEKESTFTFELRTPRGPTSTFERRARAVKRAKQLSRSGTPVTVTRDDENVFMEFAHGGVVKYRFQPRGRRGRR